MRLHFLAPLALLPLAACMTTPDATAEERAACKRMNRAL